MERLINRRRTASGSDALGEGGFTVGTEVSLLFCGRSTRFFVLEVWLDVFEVKMVGSCQE